MVQNKNIGHSLVPEVRDLYEAWLEFSVKDDSGKEIFHSGFLQPDGAIPVSLLSGAAIEAAGQVILNWPGPGAKARSRAWLADPFRVLVTLTNLRGVPYRVTFEAGSAGQPGSSFYVDHADHGLFAFSPSGRSRAALDLRGDEHLVHDAETWADFAEFAKATGAFPGGFPPRRLTRPVADYVWLGVALPG